MSSGERLLGSAKSKQSDTEALCQPPPPPRSIFFDPQGGGGGVVSFFKHRPFSPPALPLTTIKQNTCATTA